MHPAAPVTGALAVGDDGLFAAEPPPGAEVLDLQGACVVPGLNDAHVHFPTWALAQTQVRLEGAHSLEDALAAVAAGLGERGARRVAARARLARRRLGGASGPVGARPGDRRGAHRADVEGLPLALAQQRRPGAGGSTWTCPAAWWSAMPAASPLG